MSLNLSTTGGAFTPYLSFNAKAGRFFVKLDDGRKVEIVGPRLAMDLAHIRTGWICYPEKAPPQKLWDVDGLRPPKPLPVGGIDFKEGFEVLVYGGEPIRELAGQKLGLREFSSTANAVKAAIKKAYEDFTADRDAHPGHVPVFAVDGVTLIKGRNGDSFQPTFVLEKWIDRALVPGFPRLSGTGTAAGPAATAATPVTVPPRPASAADPLLQAEF